jgi:outer membrane cobalamin receptor
MRALTLGTGLLVQAHHAALAADEPPLAEIEVTAKPISEAEQRAPTAFVSVVATSPRDSEFVTATDVLQEIVGVQVQRFGGLGAFSTISIRGSSANQVPIYLDGIPLSQAQDQTVNLADLPLDSLQRIEVYRGTVPVGFGGGGIGGVVNLVTKPPSATPSTELSAGYGSFETRKVVASHTQELGGFDVLAHLTYLGSQGDFTYQTDNGTPQNPHDDFTATRMNNAFNSVGGLLKGTRQLADGVALDATEEFFFKDQGVPGPGTATGPDSQKFNDTSLLELRSLSYLRLRAKGLAGGSTDASASVYGVYNLQEFDDPLGAFGAAEDTHNQTALVGANTTGTWYAPFNQAVSWFNEIAYEQFFPYNATNPPLLPANGPDQTRLRVTVALQDEIALVSDRVTVVPSVRYEHLLDQFSGVNSVDIPNTPPQTNHLDLWTPAVGAQGRIAPWLSVRGNIGRFQRAPNFAELFGNAGSVVGNADLKPETGINRDVGFVATLGASGWLDRAQLEYAYFHNNVSNLIAFEQASRTQFRAFNIGDARLEGNEVALTAGAFRHTNLELNYTHQNTADLSRKDSPFGDQLPLRPADEVFARTELFNDWGKLFYEYTYVSSNPTDPANFIIVPSRSIHTIGMAATPRPWIAIQFEAANITNADVRDLGDFPLPGLSFFGSIKVTM